MYNVLIIIISYCANLCRLYIIRKKDHNSIQPCQFVNKNNNYHVSVLASGV